MLAGLDTGKSEHTNTERGSCFFLESVYMHVVCLRGFPNTPNRAHTKHKTYYQMSAPGNTCMFMFMATFSATIGPSLALLVQAFVVLFGLFVVLFGLSVVLFRLSVVLFGFF